MLNQFAVEIPTFPVNQDYSLNSRYLKGCRKERLPSILDTHGISGNVFADPHASSSAPYPQELNQWHSSTEEPLHPSENRCHLASTLKPEEREFVVDSGASMHMISKKDLSNAEMDTLTKSRSLTIVITANGEVQTQEEAIVYVQELGFFLTMKVLENTPAVLSLGKLFR